MGIFDDYFWPCLIFLWICYLFETYLAYRQRSLYKTVKTVPAELRDSLDQETFEKSRLYQIDRSTFGFYSGLYSQCEITISRSIVFLLLMMFIGNITGLPWLVYQTFVIEERHGFNKQTVRFFIWDQIKGVLVQLVLMPPIIAGLLFFIRWGGEYFYVYTWLFLFVVTMVMATIYPNFIAPLFDTYTPLPSGDLRTAIEQLAASLYFPLKKLFVVDGSRRSSHSNAYFYGFWNNKRIVLYDTLLDEKLLKEVRDSMAANKKEEDKQKDESKEQQDETAMEEDNDETLPEGETTMDDTKHEVQSENNDDTSAGGEKDEVEKRKGKKHQGCNTDEILAVLAHELGHWKMSHTLKHLVINQVNMFLMLFTFGYFMGQDLVFTSFGFHDGHPTMIGLFLVFQFIFSPYYQVLMFLMIQLTRMFEYQADKFAADLNKSDQLISALTKLHKDNLSFPIADHLYSMFHHSHPTFLERVRVLATTSKKRD